VRNHTSRFAVVFTLGLFFHANRAFADDHGEWVHLGISGLAGHVAVYDAPRDRMLIFGGDDNGRMVNDTWALHLSRARPWEKLAFAGPAPSPRSYAMVVHDAPRERLVVFGGWPGGDFLDDVWALSLSGEPAWTEITTAGGPTLEAGGVSVFDSVHDRAVIILGEEVWSFSLAPAPEWTRLEPEGTGPGERASPVAIHDPVRDRIVYFGGEPGDWPLPSDAWSLDLSTSPPVWEELEATGTRPQGRLGATAILDAAGRRMVVYGGTDYGSNFQDAWALSLDGTPEWKELTHASPPVGRSAHTAVYDSARDRMVIFSGAIQRHGPPDRNDVWALSLSHTPAWSPVNGTSPEPRSFHAVAYDRRRDRMIIFGGYNRDTLGFYNNEFWSCTLGSRPTWSRIEPAGDLPSPRSDVRMIYDAPRDRMIVLGGQAYNQSCTDVFELSLAAAPVVTRLETRGTPPGGIRSAILDSRHNRIVVIARPDNQVWTLCMCEKPQWEQLDTGGTQIIPDASDAVYDAPRDRMLVFGEDGHREVWALSLSGEARWTRLVSEGPCPSARENVRVIRDTARDRVVMFGGDGVATDNVWALSLAPQVQWEKLSPSGGPGPFGERGQSVIYDPVRDRMIVFGGEYLYNELNEAWVLLWGAPAPPEQPALADALKPGYPNPFNPRVTIPYELEHDTRATLAVYDVAGRLVKTLVNEWTPGGSHAAVWDGTSEAGEPVSSGVYFCHLRTEQTRASQKLVLIK
jgi:hypothetical protein